MAKPKTQPKADPVARDRAERLADYRRAYAAAMGPQRKPEGQDAER